ncbi:MAG: hypothetical protein KF831_11060 [Acidobacteria bacterium]|nr:hypothetical protein [Acidobacteriota bacterium]
MPTNFIKTKKVIGLNGILLLLLLCGVAGAQNELPEIGELKEALGKSLIYVIADGEARTAVLNAIKKHDELELAESADAAELLIEYKKVSTQNFGFGGTTETGQIYVYVLRDGKRVIVWEDSGTGGGFKGDTARRLINRFFRDLERLNKKK